MKKKSDIIQIQAEFIFQLVFLLFISNFAYSQKSDFIKNGSFEFHKKISGIDFRCGSCFDNLVAGWETLNSSAQLCDCNYTFTELEKYQGVPIRNCLKKAFTDKNNCTYVELGFASHITDNLSLLYAPGKRAIYISQRLKTNLNYGDVYEISFKIYIPKKYNSKAKQLKKHMGFNLSYNKLPDINSKGMYKIPFIAIDTFEFNKWLEVNKIVRPLCDAKYLTLGVFADDVWPDYYSERFVIYFIDNVSIKKVDKNFNSLKIHNFKCYYQSNENIYQKLKESTVYFDTNKDDFYSIDTSQLKKIINKAKKDKLCIEISGHTDNTGMENYELSYRRAINVQNFILDNFKIDPIHFILEAKADSFPIGNNNTEKGKKLNRRVVIKLTDIPIAQKIYVNILKKKISGDPTIFKSIFKWLFVEDFKKHLLLLFDYRLSGLHQKPQWQEVYLYIKNEYKKYNNPDLAFVLDSLTGEDQRYRTLEYSFISLTSSFSSEITAPIKTYYENIPDSISTIHDKNNLEAILFILDTLDWPKISNVGIRASKSAYYIIDHSNDLELINKYLPLLKNTCIEGEAEWNNYANLYDRSMYIQDLPQKYGTHYVINEENIKYYKYKDFDEMNREREKIGLKKLSKDIGFRIK